MTGDLGPGGPLARLRQLDAALLGARSATAALERWCELHRIDTERRLVAERVQAGPARPDAARRRRLRIDDRTQVRYRRVRLRLGGTVLSEAENWYVPSRLTASMQRLLDRTDMPFGRAVHALGFRRRTLSTHLLWDGAAALADPEPPGFVRPHLVRGQPVLGQPVLGPPVLGHPVLRHRAVLVRRDGLPFSEVIETYTAAVLPDGSPA